ncbi:hypothetical protein Lepto1489_21815 (plasmid) [Leptospira interrogans serovar Bataviae]|uniref:Uncharacterized protein n=1 Tax=Leptospira interrogans serovar Bataviae TaxID=312175 RepID=A0AAQ0B4Z1_LEPIR|nr:hypothetical protein Lepto1489_21815 [Leptospira interrogans serovar Bataviae]
MNAGYIFAFLFVKLVLSTKCKGCMNTLINKCSFLRVGSGDGAWIHVKNLVSISCHIKPYVQFSRIRLSDSLLPPAFKYYLVNPPER